MLNMAPSDVPKAEAFARAQRVAGARFLRMDKKRAANPADIAMCERVIAAGRTNAVEYENLLQFPEVNALFCRRALFYRPGH